MNLSTYLTLTMCGLVFVAAGAIAAYSFELLKDSKVQDRWIIYYLQLGNEATRLENRLDEFLEEIKNPKNDLKPVAEFMVNRGRLKHLSGTPLQISSLKQLEIKSLKSINGKHIAQFNGQNYLVIKKRRGSKVIQLWRSNIHKWLGLSQSKNRDATIYMINRAGKLVFTNRANITTSTLKDRKLVQKFIDTPLRQGQVYFDKEFGFQEFGFFSEIKDSNLVLMAEVPYMVILKRILYIVKRFFVVVVIIITLTLILIQIPMARVIDPIRELLIATESIARGNFNIGFKRKTYGELALLVAGFKDMALSLIQRDREIEILLVDKAQKAVLENELKIAQEIQSNFLPTKKGRDAESIFTDFAYVPAGECAGDWFDKYSCDQSGEFIAAIADVSGHGAGSSMFTAIIASIFVDLKYQQKDGGLFSAEEFFNRINRTFLEIGKCQWHATAQVIKISQDRSSCTVYNAGHVFPFLVPSGSGRKAKRVLAPGSILGVNETIEYSEKKVGLTPGTTILMMTDGLLETRNMERKEFGLKRIKKILEADGPNSPSDLISGIINQTDEFRGKATVEDDSCILGVKVG